MKKSPSSKKFKVGLGVVSYNRPDYLQRVMDGVAKHLMGEVDTIWVYNDGSTKDYSKVYELFPSSVNVQHAKKNKGVAEAKNWLMQKLLDEGCYIIIIAEDDIIPVHKKAVRGYIQAARASGISHMMFAHHGPGNAYGASYTTPVISTYPACVGAWSFFTKPGLEQVGLHDTNFHNAYEHVELTWRHVKAGLTTPWGYFADATGSDKWLKEIPESIDNSSIRKTTDWSLNTFKSLEYWKNKDPDFPLQHTLDDVIKQLKEAGDDKSTSTNKKKTR